MKILINYCLNPGIDYYKDFPSLFSAYRFFIKHKKDFYFFSIYTERKGKALELKYLKCNYLGNKKPEIELKN